MISSLTFTLSQHAVLFPACLLSLPRMPFTTFPACISPLPATFCPLPSKLFTPSLKAFLFSLSMTFAAFPAGLLFFPHRPVIICLWFSPGMPFILSQYALRPFPSMLFTPFPVCLLLPSQWTFHSLPTCLSLLSQYAFHSLPVCLSLTFLACCSVRPHQQHVALFPVYLSFSASMPFTPSQQAFRSLPICPSLLPQYLFHSLPMCLSPLLGRPFLLSYMPPPSSSGVHPSNNPAAPSSVVSRAPPYLSFMSTLDATISGM